MMKTLVLLLLIGFSSASSFHETVKRAADELADNLVDSLERSPLLNDWLRADDEGEITKEEVEKKLREILDNILAKIKDAIEHGKKVREDFLEKLKEIREKMKDLNIDAGEKSKEILEKIKERAKDYFKNLLEKLGLHRRAAEKEQLDIRALLRKLKDYLKENVETEVIKKKILELFGEGSEIVHQLLQTLKEHGKNKLKILLDLIFDDDDDEVRKVRSLKEMWEKIKDYFKDLKIDLQEKYMRFGEWVKTNFKEGFENTKDKLDNIRAIAKEFLKHTKGVSKEVASEAQEFLRQYKEDLGTLWEEVKEAVKEVMQRKDD